jgi:hypothetical protein
MSQPIELTIKSSILDKHRHLIIDPGYLEFDDYEPPTRFEKDEITAFRYGVKWIRGYQFVIGRIYVIDILSSDKKIIKIRLKSLYGVNKSILHQKFVTIVNALADNYFDDISRSYLEKFDRNESIKVEDVFFNAEGISWNNNMPIIKWDDIGTKAYQTYYSIFSKSNPSNYKTFQYLSDWNTGVIYIVSRSILKGKGLYSE